MPKFDYKGRNRSGGTVSGTIEADSERAVIARLRDQGIMATSVTAKPAAIEIKLFKKKVSIRDLAIFTRQFSTMINSGLPLVQCLDILSTQTENPEFCNIISAVKLEVEGGATFAEALNKHPKTFDQLFVNMVEAGEVGGILDIILNRLAAYIEKSEALRKKIKSALMYPMTVSFIAIAIVILLLTKVVPTFAEMFTGLGQGLPKPTEILMAMSDFTQRNILYILGTFAGIVFGVKQARTTPKGRMFFDRLILRMPVFGILLRKVAVAKFTRTLGTLISSGVSILEGLNITARTAGNMVLEEAIMGAKVSIQGGENISDPLRRSQVFPPMVTSMIAVGEETGALDEMLVKIADFYDEEVDTAVEGLTSLIEPLLMAFLGVVIGAVIIALFMPMLKMTELIN